MVEILPRLVFFRKIYVMAAVLSCAILLCVPLLLEPTDPRSSACTWFWILILTVPILLNSGRYNVLMETSHDLRVINLYFSGKKKKIGSFSKDKDILGLSALQTRNKILWILFRHSNIHVMVSCSLGTQLLEQFLLNFSNLLAHNFLLCRKKSNMRKCDVTYLLI